MTIVQDSGVAIDGSYYLESATGGTNTYVVPADGAEYYKPKQGDPVFGSHVFTDASSSGRPGVLFGMSDDGQDGYGIFIDTDHNNQWGIRTYSGRTRESPLAVGNNAPSANTWYFPAVDWGSDGSISITMYEYDGGAYTEFDSLSVSDNTRTGGKIGFFANNETCRWDGYDIDPNYLP
ncbi:hypothetical protein SAMN05192561_11264 [Halopenitus malekzadehii]|uniref:Uncharacterized protein n=2 Tax=Halopenitus malekzadehii TaxID=1267564 RepID=A0A1H6JKI9_9EURY|nr:hypothetical protein SAMN05192561_11264 [Halopenitus malekzadehii]